MGGVNRRIPSGLGENVMRILDDKLHGKILSVHICHFSLDIVISHNSRCEDHGKILRGHLFKY